MAETNMPKHAKTNMPKHGSGPPEAFSEIKPAKTWTPNMPNHVRIPPVKHI